MNSATGRWVSGEDFFNRDRELRILETKVRDRNHVLLTGQRRMGKTSIVRELGRRLEADDDGHRFASRLLKDWWTARFRDHHIPIRCRFTDNNSGELTQ